MLFLVVAAGVLLPLVTYRSWVDGPLPAYVFSLACGALAALLVGTWLSTRRAPGWAVALAAAACFLPAVALHAVRFSARNAPLTVALESPPAYRRLLEPELRENARLESRGGALVLSVPSGSTGYLRLKQPDPAQVSGAPIAFWALPRGLLAPAGAAGEPPYAEELEGQTRVTLERAYLVLLDTDGVLVQVTRFGLLVSPREPGGGTRDAVGIDASFGEWQRWVLRRAGGMLSFSATAPGSGGNGPTTVLWSRPYQGGLREVRLGETRTDQEHGGSLEMRALRYSRARSLPG